MSEPIVVDIGAAMQTLEANPDLARKMNELVLGPVIAEQLAAREALINQLGGALAELAAACDGEIADVFRGEIGAAHRAAHKALAEYRAYTGQETTT